MRSTSLVKRGPFAHVDWVNSRVVARAIDIRGELTAAESVMVEPPTFVAIGCDYGV